MFDSHCHLHDSRIMALAPDLVARAQQAGLTGVLLAGVDRDSWPTQAALRRRFASRHFSVALSYGVHPQVVPELSASALSAQLASLHDAVRGSLRVDGELLEKPDAIGELGLDSYSETTRAALPLQERVFREQLALARDVDLPIVLHILRTHADALRILKQDGVPRSGGVVHSYSGSASLCQDYLRLGLHISFAGGVTREHAPKLRAAVLAVPDERLLVETDAPDQTPAPLRPALCEPAFLPAILAVLSVMRGQTLLHLSNLTEQNARRLFRLPLP